MNKPISFLKYMIIIFELLLLLEYFINIKNKSSSISKNSQKNNMAKIINILKRKIYNKTNKNKTYINILYIKGISRFGNYLISLNNAIIFCEILRCKKIIIKNNYINHKIFYREYNITIESNYSSCYIDNDTMVIKIKSFFYHFNFPTLGEVNRFYVFRKEILNNLPKVKVNFNDLYIHIRGGDIFSHLNKSSQYYGQPPLCFYKRVLNQFIFREIIIISEDILNPVIQILLKEYPNIKYSKNNLKLDISYLVNSYNILSSKSSFITSIIKLNQNLKFLWEYDFYELSEKYLYLHYSVYTFSFKYIIYKMMPSETYKKIMFPFHNSEKQRKFMIEEKCENNFL